MNPALVVGLAFIVLLFLCIASVSYDTYGRK